MKRGRAAAVCKLCLAAFFLAAVVVPLVRMLCSAGADEWRAVLSSPQFLTALKNSALVSLTATGISVALAFLLAESVYRTDIRAKGVFSVLLTLPMLVPSISHGMGLVVLFGANGVLTNLFGLQGSIYGFWGVVCGYVMYAFPVAFLMLADVFLYEDGAPYDAANVLGISRARQTWAITLPYLKKPMIAVLFSTFTLVATDYGVPLMVGGKCTTLPVMLYQEVVGLLNFGKGSVIGVFLLLPALAAFLVDTFSKERAKTAFVTAPYRIRKSRLRDGAAYALCTAVSACVLLPIGAFLVLALAKKYPYDMTVTFDHVASAFRAGAGRYLGNAVCISLLTAAFGAALAFLAAYFTARMPSRFTRALHLFSTASLAVPGIVLGLSYVMLFRGSLLYGTLAILVLVNCVHFFATPYLMLYQSLRKMNADLESVGTTLCISRLRMALGVVLPQSAGTILEGMTYFFVNSMMTISAVSFLANVSTKPIALMITQFEAQMQLESASLVALVILVVNLAVKGAAAAIKRANGRKKA